MAGPPASTAYEIRHRGNTFYATVEVKSPAVQVLSLGGQKYGCVRIQLDRIDRRWEGMLHVGYDKRCNADGALSRSQGTISMLKAALLFAWHHFKKLEVIGLKDQSVVDCNGMPLSLPAIYLAEHRKTWYEKHFGFECEDASHAVVLNRYQRRLDGDDWSEFRAFLLVSANGALTAQMQALWKQHGSVRKIIVFLKQQKRCDALVAWLDTYFASCIAPMDPGDVDYVIKRPAATAALSFTQLDANPYEKHFEERRRRSELKMKRFENAVPRRTGQHEEGRTGGSEDDEWGAVTTTRWPLGREPLTAEEFAAL